MRTLLPLAALLLLLAPLGSAAAQQQDDAWRLDPRTVTSTQLPDGAALTSLRSSSLAQDQLDARLDATTARLDLHFSATRPQATDSTLGLQWQSLVEYRDTDGDGHYGLADEEVQHITIGLLPHRALATQGVDGAQVASVTYDLPSNSTEPFSLPGTGGTLVFTVTLVPRTQTLGAQDIDPTMAALTAEVTGFPYKAPDTALALVTSVTATGPLEATSGGVFRLFGDLETGASWLPTVRTDGLDLPATTSSSTQGSSANLVQSWPRGDQQMQEGSASVVRWQDVASTLAHLRGDWRFFVLGLAGAVVALGVPSWKRLRET